VHEGNLGDIADIKITLKKPKHQHDDERVSLFVELLAQLLFEHLSTKKNNPPGERANHG